MARSRDYKSIRYDSAIDGHCAACSSANLRQASSNRRSMSRGWLAERTGTTRPRRRRRAVRHMPYLPHRTHQLALRARRGSQQERHRLSAGPQRKPSSSFFSRDARQCVPPRICCMCIPTWDGLATPVPEVRDFWKKASYEWRRRLASASRLALRWPLLPPFARRQCPRLTPAQRPEVCHPPRVLTAQVRPTATPAHLSRCLSGMASRSD